MAEDEQRDPIVSGPEQSRLPTLEQVGAVLRGLVARSAASTKVRSRTPAAERAPRRPRSRTEPTREQVQAGAPAFILAPAYLGFAAVCALPMVARALRPNDPRAFVAGVVDGLPDWAAPIEGVWNGWLWAPWWILVPALLMRLNAVRITVSASLNAVGSGMAALVLSAAAWLYHGRGVLGREGVPAVERDGAWQLLVAEFVFLFLVATWFSPNMGKRTRFEQG